MTPEYKTETGERVSSPPLSSPPFSQGKTSLHPTAAHSFAQTFGYHASSAVLIVTVDTMLFGSTLATAGFIIPLTLAVACGLGVAVYYAQRKWYGDEVDVALWKAGIAAGLTAIPTAIPGLITIPFGIVGMFRRKER